MQSTDNTEISTTAVEIIAPSGQTDDIRYVLNPEPEAPSEKNRRADVSIKAVRLGDADAPLGSDSAGLADQAVDDVDAQLPDHNDSTVRGGQLATESKRGAY
jgi:hypothetical protein